MRDGHEKYVTDTGLAGLTERFFPWGSAPVPTRLNRATRECRENRTFFPAR